MKLPLLLLLLASALARAVTPADYASPLTAAAEYSFPATVPAGNKATFTLAGDFSGAAVTIGYISPAGTFTTLGQTLHIPGVSTAVIMPVGPSPGLSTPALSIAGGVAPAITLRISQVNPGTTPLNAASIIAALGYIPAVEG